jgi:hypothetical protein
MVEPAVSLKEYVDALLKALETRIEQARISMEKRLDGMNEFRDALRDQAANSPTRNEVETELEAIKKDIKTLISFMDTVGSKASQGDVNRGIMFSIIGLVIGAVGLLWGIFK